MILIGALPLKATVAASKRCCSSANLGLFLTGDKNYIYDLSNKGFNIYAGENNKVAGGFEHSGLFALIDKEGNIRCRKDKFGNPILYYDGLEKKGVKAITEDIKKLLNE